MKKKKILYILLLIIIVLILILIGSKLYIFLDREIRYREFEKIETLEIAGNLNYIEDDNCAVVDNMDFVYQNNVGVKVNSISVTDDTMKINISFKVNEGFDYKTFGYFCTIYDENKNIYTISPRMHMGENSKYDYDTFNMQRELGVSRNNDIYSFYLSDGYGIENKTKNDEENVISTTVRIDAKDKFPLSKKIYIKICDLGYFNIIKSEDGKNMPENVNLNNCKWLFEFDIPEKMNERDTLDLKLSEGLPDFEVTSITLTDSKLVLKFKSEEYVNLINSGKDMPGDEFISKCHEMLNITDGQNVMLQELSSGTTEDHQFKITYNYSKDSLPQKLFINYKVGDNQYRSELIEK